MKDFKTTRRGFLKATGVLAGLAAAHSVMGCRNLTTATADSAPDPMEGVTVVTSSCRMCHGGCAVLVHVRNGRVIKVEGSDEGMSTNQGTLCPKGLATIQHQYNPRRLRYPLKRVGERGAGQWQRISWDEAYDIIIDKLRTANQENMAHATGTSREFQEWMFRFVPALGIRLNAFGMPPICFVPRVQMSTRMLGYRLPAPDFFGFKGDKNPGVILNWGGNIIHTNPDGISASALLRARYKGAKMVTIDPVYHNLAAKSDIWLPVRPATDGALAMGFLNVAINENLYNKEFVEKWSNLPGLIRVDNGRMLTQHDLAGTRPEPFRGPPHAVRPQELVVFWDADKNEPVLADGPDINPVMSGSFEVDLPGQGRVRCRTAWDALVARVNEYPPARVAEMTGVNEEDIVTVARMIMNDGPIALQWGVSFDMAGVNSADAIQAALMLICLSGSLDVPGGMVMWEWPRIRTNSFPSEFSEAFVWPEMNLMSSLPPHILALNRRWARNPWGGVGSNYFIEAVAKGRQRCEFLWIQGANPLLSTADSKQTLRALENVEFTVMLDLFMNSAAQMADLVLPMAMWTERSHISQRSLHPMYQARVKAVEPVGECRSDEMSGMGLARKLAEDNPEHWNRLFPWTTEEGFLDWRLEPLGVTWDEFKQQRAHTVPQRPLTYKETRFRLPAGKAELYFRAKMDHGEDPLPRVREQPYFSRNNTALSQAYPFYSIPRRVGGYFHSEYFQLPYVREIWPEPVIEINNATAARLGIAEGDWVCIEGEKGVIKQKARLTPGIAPDTVFMDFGWWFPEVKGGEQPHLSGIHESNKSVVTNNDWETGFDALIGTPIVRGFFVNIYKAPDGPPAGLNPQEAFTWMPDTREVK